MGIVNRLAAKVKKKKKLVMVFQWFNFLMKWDADEHRFSQIKRKICVHL